MVNESVRGILIGLLVLLVGNCGGKPKVSSPEAGQRTTPAVGNAATTPSSKNSPSDNRPRIVAFGDSLTAGYGLSSDESYPALLQETLDREGYEYEVVNAGVSGDTTAGGLRRIDWALEGDVKILVLELGANDILRGQSIKLMKENLNQIIDKAKAKNVQVLLCGMYAPTSDGPDYQAQVTTAFKSLAEEQKVAFMPFFLESVGGMDALNQGDGVHPGVEGTRIVTTNVYKALAPMLRNGEKGKG